MVVRLLHTFESPAIIKMEDFWASLLFVQLSHELWVNSSKGSNTHQSSSLAARAVLTSNWEEIEWYTTASNHRIPSFSFFLTSHSMFEWCLDIVSIFSIAIDDSHISLSIYLCLYWSNVNCDFFGGTKCQVSLWQS